MLNLQDLSFSPVVEFVDSGFVTLGNGERLEGLPPLTRVRWELVPEKGSVIHCEAWLPENWNGIFWGCGNGGLGVGVPLGGLARFVRDGSAAATCDLGTSPGWECGIGNPAVWRNYGWRATHLMTECAKDVVKAFYGREAQYCYFCGGSTGGQQAMSEAQRFPEDYDGIAAGAPAHNRVRLHTYFLWTVLQVRAGREGYALFSEDQCRRIHARILEFHQMNGDGKPGDPFLHVPRHDAAFRNEMLACLAAREKDITEMQLQALARVYEGPRQKSGAFIHEGLPPGTEFESGLWEFSRNLNYPHLYLLQWVYGKEKDPFAFDFDSDFNRCLEQLECEVDAVNPDLSAFAARGGRLLIMSGSADAVVPYCDALDFVRRASPENAVRFFLAPSWNHSVAGFPEAIRDAQGRTALSALRAWRENGDSEAPEGFTCAVAEKYRGAYSCCSQERTSCVQLS